MFYGFPYPFGFPCSFYDPFAINRYKAWWWKLILRRRSSAGTQ